MKSIYVCGPTVYDDVHIGNIRPLLVFDFYIKALTAKKEDYIFIHNLTDIDDKIIKKSKETGISEEKISEKYSNAYKDIIKRLNCTQPTHMPSVVENIDLIISDIKKMVDSNDAYVSNGSVYFDVRKFKEYGSISNRKLEDMEIEDENQDKKSPYDFVLWKKTDEGVNWDSPWSKGRPGWHTECVSFVNNYNKHKQLYLHGGGVDLKFPHHENENIQFISMNKQPITKSWMHVGHLNLENEKMSKSLGNIIKAKDLLNEHSTNLIRLIFFMANPTTPMNYSKQIITSAQSELDKYERLAKKVNLIHGKECLNDDLFINAVENFQFSNARKRLEDLIKSFNKDNKKEDGLKINLALKIIGIDFKLPNISTKELDLIKEWEMLKNDKNFEKADILREKLIKLKII